MNSRRALFLFAALLALPGLAATTAPTPAPAAAPAPAMAPATASAPASAKPPAKSPAKPPTKKKAPAKPAAPEDLTAPSIRHVVVCPPPKISQCAMRKPISTGFRVLTNGVEVANNETYWLVDFGKGPQASPFLLQVLDAAGSMHDIEVTFRSKAGMHKTPTLPEE